MRASICLLLLAVSAVGAPAQTTTFVDVNVVRVAEGDILPSQTVVVTDGRVTAVTSANPTSTQGITVDGRGHYLVPGLAVFGARLPGDNWMDWREVLLVYLAHGVTTLGVTEAEIGVLDRARMAGEDVWPRPVLLARSELDSLQGWANPVRVPGHASELSLPSLEGDPLAALRRHALDLSGSPIRVAEIEPGAPANLLLLAEDPLRDATATRHPAGIMVVGQWISYTDFATLALEFARARRLEYVARVPRNRTPEGPWPDYVCVGESLDDCFGGDAECGLQGVLGLAGWMWECGAPSVRAYRKPMLDALDRLALVNPTDDWLVGQRVHFALIDGDPDRAWVAAGTCASETWWCQALRGWVVHEHAPGSAHAQFDSAYANAPDDTPAWSSPRIPEAGDRGLHCEWSDLGYLIEDPELLASYRAEECGTNVGFEARFWWLADPLWSQEGNERRDEHISRNIRMRIRDDYRRLVYRNHAHCVSSGSPSTPSESRDPATSEYRGVRPTYYADGGQAVAEDCANGHSAIIPFGLPNSWRGVPYRWETGELIGANGRLVDPESDAGAKGNRYVSDHTYYQLRVGFLNGGYSFVPDANRFLDPMESSATDWAVTRNEGHERMLTRETWYNLEHQTAVLRRGEELAMLAAARFPDTLSSFERLEGFLAAGRVTDHHIEVVPAEVDPTTGILRVRTMLPDDEWMASIEALSPEFRGRARHGAPAPPLTDGYGISNPVLVRPDFDFEQADLLEAMLPSKGVEEERVGLYFELYGVEADEVVELTLTHDAVEGPRGFFGRIASWIGIGRRGDQTTRLQWTERVADVTEGIARAFVALDLRDFGAGEHRITLTASAGGRTASGTTGIHIRQ